MSADMFDDYPQTSKYHSIIEAQSTNNYEQQATNDNQMYDGFPNQTSNNNAYAQQNSNGQSPTKSISDAFVVFSYVNQKSPEQMQRREKLRQIEDERIKQVSQKEESERKEKREKQQNAQNFLKEYKQYNILQDVRQKQNELTQRQKQNRENQVVMLEARKNQNDYKNPWDKVGQNITLKDGEYPGKKDVGKMRQAILNKKADLNR